MDLVGIRTILNLLVTVQGISKVSVKPTRTVISYEIRSIEMDYAKAVESVVKRVNLLSKNLENLGFQDKDIVTTNFNVGRNTLFDRGSLKDSGFVATQVLKIQFEQNEDKLIEVLNKSTASEADPEIVVTFELDSKNKIEVQNELIKLAVLDAEKKAELIASTSNYQIIGIEDIDYHVSPGGYSGDIFPVTELNEVVTTGYPISKFEASELTLSDEILVIYRITKK